jgi:hypothetical protein
MLALVAGTGRSGTTLVQETLSRHQGVGFVSGLDDKVPRLNSKGRFNGVLYRMAPPRPASMRALAESTRLLERGRARVAPSEAYRLIDRQVMSGFSTPCRDLLADDMTPHLRDRFVDFFGSRERAQRCDVLLQHLTGWPRTGFLRAAFPDLKVVNVVRDGRAVANSWLQMGWWDGWAGPDKWIYGPLPEELQEEWEQHDRSFPVLAALGWTMLMDAFERARDQMPAEQWLDVHYEDILADPRREFGVMLGFLGLEWDDQFERGFARHEITAGRAHSYREELGAAQLAAVEEVLAKPLARWGYEVGADD